jgi:hypothetical protein
VFGVVRLTQEEIPQPELTCFHFELLDYGNHCLPPLHRIFGNLRMCEFHGWKDFILIQRSIMNLFLLNEQYCKGPTYLKEIYEFRERFFPIGCELVLDLYDMSLPL